MKSLLVLCSVFISVNAHSMEVGSEELHDLIRESSFCVKRCSDGRWEETESNCGPGYFCEDPSFPVGVTCDADYDGGLGFSVCRKKRPSSTPSWFPSEIPLNNEPANIILPFDAHGEGSWGGSGPRR